MVKNAFRVAIRNPSSLVFVVVVMSGYIMAYLRASPPLSSAELLWLVGLGIIYSFIGTFIFWVVIASGSVKFKILYLVVQFLLGMTILQLARGNGWLAILPLVSHSVAFFSPREAVIPCLLILMGISWNTSQMMVGWVPFFQSALIFGSIVLTVAVFTNLAVREARAREDIERLTAQLEQANRELQDYAAKVEEVTAIKERNRLAREIHDGLGHYLTAMNIQAKVASALIEQNPPQARSAIDKIQGMVLAALADVRQSIAALRMDGISGKHLPEVLIPLITESREAGMATEMIVQGEPRPLSPASELTIYRAVQEGLTNVRKHAQASRVEILLEYRPREIFLQVRDNGRGAVLSMDDLREVRDSYGLFGLRERTQLLGGEMRIATGPGAGFCLEVILPESEEMK